MADIVVFDPECIGTTALERLHDLPTGADRLVARSTGIEHIFVAGVAIRHQGIDLPVDGPGRWVRPTATEN
jgi:N-acyl-D-aspartate/D-glutamate deacylase